MIAMQPDVKYAKSYATYERAVKAVEELEAKTNEQLRVTIAAVGDKHDRFSPLIHLTNNQGWMMGSIAHYGFMVTTYQGWMMGSIAHYGFMVTTY